MNPDPRQRMDALKRANRIRSRRAVLKAELTSGQALLADVLFSRSVYLQTMRIQQLLLATPKIGHAKVVRAFRYCWLSSASTVGGTSKPAKERLLAYLAKNVPSVETGYELEEAA